MIKQLLKKKDGFTLVELLAVIVILAIIAAIAVPSVANIINNTKKDAKVAEAIQIVDAAKLYVASHDVTSKTTLSSTQLGSYVNNVSADASNYKVTVNFDTNGSPSYSISDQALSGIGNFTSSSADESALLSYKNGN